jgi:vacuolar-type H+-ATPase subunit F/Vma7
VTAPRAGRARGLAWAIGDRPTVQALALAGLRGRVVESAAAARLALAEARAAGATLVVVTEQLAGELDGTSVDGGVLPLVAVVPSAAAPRVRPSPGERRSRAVRRALGMPDDRAGGRP